MILHEIRGREGVGLQLTLIKGRPFLVVLIKCELVAWEVDDIVSRHLGVTVVRG
jgi:hypothetical protein